MEQENRDTYQQEAKCKNCDFFGNVDTPKGKKLEEMICPECGNDKVLVKKLKPYSFGIKI